MVKNAGKVREFCQPEKVETLELMQHKFSNTVKFSAHLAQCQRALYNDALCVVIVGVTIIGVCAYLT